MYQLQAINHSSWRKYNKLQLLSTSEADEGEYWCEVTYLGVIHSSLKQKLIFGGENEYPPSMQGYIRLE